MVMRLILAAGLMLLAACEPAAQAPAGAAVDADAASMKTEARRVCGQMTGYAPGQPSGKDAETAGLLERSFNECVEAVVRGDQPALRGKSEAPT